MYQASSIEMRRPNLESLTASQAARKINALLEDLTAAHPEAAKSWEIAAEMPLSFHVRAKIVGKIAA